MSRHRMAKAGGHSLAFLVWSLVPSAYWYLRNLVVTGSSLHPLQFSFTGGVPRVSIKAMREDLGDWDTPLPCGGAWDTLRDWIVRPWTECHFAGEHFSVNSGLGPVFATFIPLAVLAAGVVTLVTLLRERRLPLMAFPVFISASILSYWWFYLYRLLRIILYTPGMMVPLLATGIGLLSGARQRLARGLFLCTMVTNAVLLGVTPLGDLASRIYHQSWSRNGHYGVAEVIDALPPNSVVLNAGHMLKNYALFGRNLRNRVVTNRALVEPDTVSRITGAFVRKWQIDYIFYATNQKLVLEDEAKYQVVHRRVAEDAMGPFMEILYRTDFSTL